MRYLLLFLSLLCGAHAAFAQAASPSLTPPDSLLAAQAAPDTVAAIHRLFAAKRKRQVIVSSATFIAAIAAVVAVSFSSQQTSGGGGGGYGILTNTGPLLDSQGLAVVGIGVLMIPVALGEALLFGGWNKKQEQLTVEGWSQHKEARFLKRRLKPKYFATPPPKKQRS